jgi:E3 ubiquitin-protein ligase TRIP12
MASFLGTIISSESNAQFVQSALQLVELLVNKLPDVYQTSFIREGVVYEIEKLAGSETEASKKAVKAENSTEDIKPSLEQLALAGPSVPSNITRQVPAFPSVLAGSRTADLPEYLRDMLAAEGMSGSLASMYQMASKKAAPTTIDVDTNIWRARVLGAKKIFDVGGDDKNEAKLVLDKLSALNGKLSKQAATEAELYDALKEIASQFSSAGSSLSSFELLRGGVIDGLLQFVDIDGTVSSAQRRSMLYEIFAETAPTSSASPMTILVKRLHESLGRLETFEVESAFNGVADVSRPSASALSRTLRVRLTAEPGQDIPKSIGALVLTIQAIAPLSALHDYLRPRVADSSPSGPGSALARILAANNPGGSGLMIPGRGGPPGSSSRMLDIPGRAQASSSSTGLSSSAPQNSGIPPPLGSSSKPSAPAPKTRRRSARLSAQHAEPEVPEATTTHDAEAEASESAAAPGNVLLSSSAPAPSNIPIIPLDMDMDFDEDEYSDEEFGDEMFENEMAAAALSRSQEKVVNMNVTPGTFSSA